MPWHCWCPAHSSSLPPSVSWLMEVWIVVHAYYQLFILCHTHWMCLCNSVMLHSGHMTSILLSILERDPPLLLSWRFLPFFPCKRFFSYFLGVVPDPLWKVKGQGCRMCTDCKALWVRIWSFYVSCFILKSPVSHVLCFPALPVFCDWLPCPWLVPPVSNHLRL